MSLKVFVYLQRICEIFKLNFLENNAFGFFFRCFQSFEPNKQQTKQQRYYDFHGSLKRFFPLKQEIFPHQQTKLLPGRSHDDWKRLGEWLLHLKLNKYFRTLKSTNKRTSARFDWKLFCLSIFSCQNLKKKRLIDSEYIEKYVNRNKYLN